MQKEDLREWLGLSGVHRQQFRSAILNPLLQVLPESKPTMMKGLPGAFILRGQLHELGAIGDQLARFGAKIDGIVSLHIWRLSSFEELGSVILMTFGRKPLARPKKGALSTVRYESATYIYTH